MKVFQDSDLPGAAGSFWSPELTTKTNHSEQIFEALQFLSIALGHWIQASSEGLG